MVDFLVFTRKFCRCQVRRSRWLCHKNCFGAGYCVMYISRLELFTTFFYLTISLEVNFLLMLDLFRIYPKSGWLNKKMAKKPQSRWNDFFLNYFLHIIWQNLRSVAVVANPADSRILFSTKKSVTVLNIAHVKANADTVYHGHEWNDERPSMLI